MAIGGVGAKIHRIRPRTGSVFTSSAFDRTTGPGAVVTRTVKTAFWFGASRQGRSLRQEIGSIIVVSTGCSPDPET